MNPFARLLRRARYLFRRNELDRAMDEEVRFHIEKETEQNVRRGMSPREARRAAMIAFGGVDRYKEATRQARGTMLLENTLRDSALALRGMRRRPLYALGVVGTLGLGLAAATITFTVAWKVWLAPMPYPDPDTVIRLYEVEPSDPTAAVPQDSAESRRHQLSPDLLEDLRANSWRTIETVSAFMTGMPWEWTRDGESQSASGVGLSPNGFEILGIVPALGRLPTEVEVEALLSERAWRTTFGSDPDIVGSVLGESSNLGAFEIVGVARLPSGIPGTPDLVSVIEWSGDEGRGIRFIDAIARVREGNSVAAAEAEMNAFIESLSNIYPEHRGWGVEAVVLATDLIRPFRSVIVLLLAAGTAFLLLAGVNVLGLVAARRVDSRHDRSIRLALGASERQLLRGSLIESGVLAAVGTIAGVLSAHWLISPIRAMVPQDVPRLGEVSVSFSLAITGLSIGLALGGVIGLAGYLVSRDAGPSVGRAPTWRTVGVGGRRALVVGQVALTTLLTAGAAAVLHRVSTLRAIDLGFEAEGVSTTLGDLGGISDAERWDVLRASLDRLRAQGIPAAAAVNTPMDGATGVRDIPLFGIRADAASEAVFYELHPVTAGYFSVMGIDVLAGRAFQPTDSSFSEKVVIVNEDFVDQYFPAGTPFEDVVGRSLEPVMLISGPTTVVGVVRSTRHQGPDTPAVPGVYIPLFQQGLIDFASVLVDGDPDGVAEAVSEVVREMTPEVPWSPLVPYTSNLSEWYRPLRFQLIMIGVLATLGLLLASLGLFSVMAYHVATDRHEIGIRKAVGAPDGSLVSGVVARGMTLASLGLAIGLGVWYRLLPLTREFVDGIDSTGSIVPLSVAIVVGGSSLIATLFPGIQAARVDPVVTLRTD